MSCTELWGRFAEGVRILVLSDSCHSGSVSRAPRIDTAARPAGVRARMMPRRAAERTYEAHKDAYDRMQQQTPLGDDQPVKATVVLLSGCQDDQVSSDGDGNGLFTATLKQVWGDGQFEKGLKEFRDVIAGLMPRWQVPNYFVVGAANAGFESQPPFTV